MFLAYFMKKYLGYLRAYKHFKAKEDRSIDFPIKVYIEPTNHCNLRCEMCPNRIMKRERGYMPLSLLKKILDDSGNLMQEVYLFHSGESLLHPKFIEMVKLLKNKGIKVVLYTNAYFLNEKNCKDLVKVGIDVISVSYHSKDVLDNINLLKRLVKGTKTKLRLQVIEGEKVDINEISDEVITRDLTSFCGAIDLKVDKSKLYGCFWAYYMIAVLWNGDIVMCCKDFDEMYKLGNVKEDKLQDVWNGDKARALRRSLISGKLFPPCSKCEKPYQKQFEFRKLWKELKF